ncbi:MAG: rhodanese-like domain-containing protein [Deltaproteobacteria bacterium]|nr:rhodanese-like domain-containing protein [Deltaproteobacteria bacterium]
MDAREAEEYRGATKYGQLRGGHIPGARLLHHEDLYAPDGSVKNADALTALFTGLGLPSPPGRKRVVAYCAGGIRSGLTYTALRLAGYENAANYEASIYDYARDLSLPLDAGEGYALVTRQLARRAAEGKKAVVIDEKTVAGLVSATPDELASKFSALVPAKDTPVILDGGSDARLLATRFLGLGYRLVNVVE